MEKKTRTIKDIMKDACPEFDGLCAFINNDREGQLSIFVPKRFRPAFEELVSVSFPENAILCIDSKEENIAILDKNISYANTLNILQKFDYERVDFIESRGQFNVKGDNITVWPALYILPIRIEFWGDSVEKFVMVDQISGRSVTELLRIIVSTKESENLRLLNDKSCYAMKDFAYTVEKPSSDISFEFEPVPRFHSNLELFGQTIGKYVGATSKIMLSSRRDVDVPDIQKIGEVLSSGWSLPKCNVVLFTELEVFDSVVTGRGASSVAEAETMLKLNIGDYVVHVDHGVAVYSGTRQMNDYEGNLLDYLVLNYAKEDKLYVPITQVSKVSKYIGGKDIKLTRLGTEEWNRVTAHARKSVELISRELLELYAKRELSEGFTFSKDTVWQKELEESFQFEETPDQKKAMNDIRVDMESGKPMDRLLVGDVGFGKTELAVRAAFKAVQEGKQVLVLAPTTILVEQHYSVFTSRMKKFPVKIEKLSRFNASTVSAEIVERLKNGAVDIAIGTHRLLSNDIEVRDLGLIIVDEEQRFGVKQKEKLRKLRESVHVLAMSATPIPRSLHMALSGIRDISILMDPPSGRKPIKTELMHFGPKKIVEIIDKEVARGGQVYLVHNDIKTIYTLKDTLQSLAPDVKFLIGHGQMPNQQLAKVMADFYEGKADVLLCSTIIENGIDIPSVNTIIIDRADKFGLSQLHQLRGRVGRSSVESFCYLLYPGEESISAKSLERINAIEEDQYLGAGFALATKDLEIRGVGNLLGREQSGNVRAVGYSLYIELIRQEVIRLKKLQSSFNFST